MCQDANNLHIVVAATCIAGFTTGAMHAWFKNRILSSGTLCDNATLLYTHRAESVCPEQKKAPLAGNMSFCAAFALRLVPRCRMWGGARNPKQDRHKSPEVC